MIPRGFVYLDHVDSTIIQEMRYAGHHNFVGRQIPGYDAARCILTAPAAEALKRVQASAAKQSLTLKVYDGYRPQKAVEYFVKWCADRDDDLMQTEFYPAVQKTQLVKEGYISPQSDHCKGSTVDLTLVPVPVPPQEEYRPGQRLVDGRAPRGVRFRDNSIDMGTGFDVFDPMAHTHNLNISPEAKGNRERLIEMMEAEGFKGYDKEWWHFVFADEPFSEPFDFDVT
jgi:zinc D-Ala-D-Ala dipeptidase